MQFPVSERPNAIPQIMDDGTTYTIQNRTIGEVNVAFSDTEPKSTTQDAALLKDRGSNISFSLESGERAWVWGWPGFIYWEESL